MNNSSGENFIYYTGYALTYLYILFGLAFSGIPGLSRGGSYIVFLLIILCLYLYNSGKRLNFSFNFFVMFYVVLGVILSLYTIDKSATILFSNATSWVAAICIVYVASYYKIHFAIVYSIITASILNSVSIFYGFDSYASYVADFRYVSEVGLAERPGGLVGNANLLAVQAILPLFVFHAYLKKIKYWIALMFIFSAAYSFYMTGSRKGLILIFCYFWCITFYTLNNKNIKYLIAFAILLFCIIINIIEIDYFDFGDALRGEVGSINRVFLALEGSDNSYLERKYLLEIGIGLVMESPIIGYGMDMFRHMNVLSLYSHNNFVEILMAGGILLFISYYSIYLCVLHKIATSVVVDVAQKKFLYAALLMMLVMDASMVTFYQKLYSIILAFMFLEGNYSVGKK